MEIFFFHLMPWPHIPDDFERRYRSSWVMLPNSCYDPVAGHRIYREYLDELATAESSASTASCVNEHHQNAYGTMPSPNIMAAALGAAHAARQDRHPRQRHLRCATIRCASPRRSRCST